MDWLSYYRVNGLSLSLLYGLQGFLSAAYPLRGEAQKLSHISLKKAAVPIVDGPIVGQDLHTWDFIALRYRKFRQLHNTDVNKTNVAMVKWFNFQKHMAQF